MHRTEGDGRETVGGLPDQHVDQNQPTTNGTTGSAEFFNALQEEIINVIERAGLTIKSSGATDRTAGFNQLETALFDSEKLPTTALLNGAVTDPKVTSVSLNKIIDGICSISQDVGGDPNIVQSLILSVYKLYLELEDSSGSPVDKKYIQLLKDSFTIERQEDGFTQERVILDRLKMALTDRATANVNKDAQLDIEKLFVKETNTVLNNIQESKISVTDGFQHSVTESAVETGSTQLESEGLQFKNSGKRIRFEVIDFSGSWNGTDPYDKTVASKIPQDSKILNAVFSIRTTTGEITSFSDAAGTVTVINTSPQNVKVVVSGYNPGAAGYDNKFVTVWYTED